jgi:COP9 signalosome complex subunit 6
VGALLGTQTGREIEIANSFEFAFTKDTLDIDHGLFITRRDQCSSPFSCPRNAEAPR